MIDWGLAAQAAVWVGGDAGEATPLPGDVEAVCADAVDRIVAYTGLELHRPVPPAETVDRATWAEANLQSMGAMLDPLAARFGEGLGPLTGPARRVGGAVIGLEAGALAGFLGRKVLGQYDLKLLEEDPAPRLLMVAPNIRNAARDLDVDLERMTTWVAVHEVTHAVQFGAVDWLRPHLGQLLRRLMGEGEVKLKGGGFKLPSLEELRETAGKIRDGSFVELATTSGGRKETFEQVQATMALIEGHAELVMDEVGVELLGDLSDLREAMDERRARAKPVWLVWIERVLGLELKMRQYEQGRKFCDAVIAASDVATLHRAWSAPELLPSLAELRAPDTWLARIDAPEPAAA